nr:muscle M-line assembly protein unc-89 isoform X1 [Nothobranchius furzeri]
MEAKYPTLVRPRRKLCYISEKKRQSDQWKKLVTLDDVDKMFDDIAEPHLTTVLHQGSYSASYRNDTQASPVLQKKRPGCQIAGRIPCPDEDFVDPVARPPDPQLYSYVSVPIRCLDPVKTSSPIEQNTNKNCIERPEYGCVVSPIFFNSEDEEPQKDPLPAQKPQCTGQVTEKRGDAADADEGLLESSPKVDVQLKKTFNKVMAKATVMDNTKPSVSATRKQPKPASAKMADTRPPAEKPAPSGKDRNAFLQKLKQAMLSNPTSNTPVKASPSAPPPEPPPELEDFLILEDDAPLYITIPSRSAKNKRNQLNKTFGSGKENPPEKGSEDLPQEEQEVEKAANKWETRAENEKVKKRRKKGKVIGSDEDCDGLTNPEDPPAGDSMERKQPKKKKQQRRKVSLKEGGEEEELPEDRVDVETEKASLKSKTKAAKYNKQILSSEDEEEIPTNKTLKDRKGLQAPKAVMEEVEADVEEQRDGEPAGDEDLGSFTAEKEVLKAEENEKRKQKEHSNKSGESSHEEVRALGKRRRKPTDEWWRISGSPKKTEPPQPPKKSKQKNSSKAPPSAAAAKKTNQKPPAHTATATGKQRRKATRKKEERVEEVDEIDTAEAEQEIPDGGLDQESSPLVLSRRDISVSSGAQMFQKVYHSSSTDKPAAPPTSPVAPKPAKDPLREAEPAKRRRKHPGSWWEVLSADNSGGTNSSSQPQLPSQEPKSQKEQKKKSKQRKASPKVGKRASEPPGGALVSPLKCLVPSRTVKDTPAALKDILTSGVNTPAVSAAHQISSPVLMPRPAETAFVTHSSAAPDVGHHSHSQPTAPHRKRPSDDTLRACMSGPSSMVDMENSEEMDLPSRAQSFLSAAALCAPPLKPLTLHSNDRANLAEWFQTLWSTTAHEPAALTPDQFQWFFHQNRALGIQVDLNSSCFCSGKILMGSYMKKPLWVDHSATTVFHLLTSSLSVTVNGTVSRYRSGQAFSVECGQAYSIQNTLSQPAVLIFNRMLAESVD